MTLIRKFAVTLLTATALLGGLGLSAQQETPAQTEVQVAAHEAQLPTKAFVKLVLGPGTDAPVMQLEYLGGVAWTVCQEMDKGFTYMSIREGLVVTEGFTTGEAGLFMAAADLYECDRP